MSRNMIVSTVALAACTLAAPMAAHAQCSIDGDISAQPNADPSLPAWKYTLVVTWDTGSQYALSHADLLIDPVGGTCSCGEIADALVLVQPAGTSEGEGGCTVPYDAFLDCNGDPSIPGVTGVLLKFEPDESAGCEPDVTGMATFVFYSDRPPVPVDEDILSLVDKYANNFCFGNLTGEFPGLVCDPVPSDDTNWSHLKSLYR
jgi:hypothetical protein